jgi:hypothetical protein
MSHVQSLPLISFALGHTPSATDDETKGFEINSLVFYNDKIYKCTSATASSATWVEQSNLGYTAENQANKTSTVTGNETSTTKYLTVKGVYDWVIGLGYITASALSGYASQAWVTSQGYITNVISSLGYTPENQANKENTTLDTSTTKYPTNNLVKTAVDAKQATLVSATNIKTINGATLLGSGDLTVTGFTAASVAEVNTGTDNAKGATALSLETSKYLNQNGAKTYATTGGSSTVYTVTLSPAITSYSAGQQFNISAHTANTTTTPTVNFNGLGAKNILNKYGTEIAVGDLQGDLIIRYNGTAFEIVSGVATNEVGNDKAAQMAANTIKGNNSGSTANQADLTVDQVNSMLANATNNTTAGALTAISTANIGSLRFTLATSIAGFANGSSGKDLIVINSNTVNCSILHDSGTESTAANRIYTGGQTISLPPSTAMYLQYNSTVSRWFIVSLHGNNYFPVLAGTGNRVVVADANGLTSATYGVVDVKLNEQYLDATSIVNTTKTGIWGTDLGSLTVTTAEINRLGCMIVGKHFHKLTTGATAGNITFDLDWNATNLITTGALALSTYIGSSITDGFVYTEAVIITSVSGASGVLRGYLDVMFFTAAGAQVNRIRLPFSTTSDLTANQILKLSVTFSNSNNTWISRSGITKLEG